MCDMTHSNCLSLSQACSHARARSLSLLSLSVSLARACALCLSHRASSCESTLSLFCPPYVAFITARLHVQKSDKILHAARTIQDAISSSFQVLNAQRPGFSRQACKKVYHQPRQPACSGWMIEHHGRVQESNVCPLAPQPSAYHEIMISVHTYAHTYSRATWPFSFDGLLLAGLFSINSQRQFSRASFYLTKKSFGNSIIRCLMVYCK